jgi:hypothetical protein
MSAEDELRHSQSLSLWLISVLEDYAVQNAKLKALILQLPRAKQPGFSLDVLLAETELAGDSVQDLRQRFSEVRRTFEQSPHPSAKAQQSLQAIGKPK